MSKADPPLSLDRQLAVLLTEGVAPGGRTASPPEVAAAVGLSYQALLNLLHGKSRRPRLHTLRALCEFYAISLDYFDCPDEADCRAHLAARQIAAASPTVRQIAEQATQLTPWGRRQMQVLLTWLEQGRR